MKHYFCTNCWRLIEEDLAFFSCPECTRAPLADSNLPAWVPPTQQPENRSAKRQQVKELRAWWRRMFAEESLSLCRKHRNTEGILYCECGERLTKRNSLQVQQNGGRMAIRVVGSRGSGKTVWLTTMCRSLRSEKTPFDLLGIGDTEMNFTIIENAILNKYERPPATKPGSNLRYAWRIKEKDGEDTPAYPILMVHDVAGEVWTNLKPGNTPQDLDRYLRYPGDLLFIIDGARLVADLPPELQINPLGDAWEGAKIKDGGAADRAILEKILDYIPEKQVKQMRLALVITKADLLAGIQDEYPSLKCDEATLANAMDSDDDKDKDLKLLLERAQRGALVTFGQSFKKCRVFATSSLGFCPTDEDIADKNTLTHPPEPKCVATPLLWLLTPN